MFCTEINYYAEKTILIDSTEMFFEFPFSNIYKCFSGAFFIGCDVFNQVGLEWTSVLLRRNFIEYSKCY